VDAEVSELDKLKAHETANEHDKVDVNHSDKLEDSLKKLHTSSHHDSNKSKVSEKKVC
jgi:hypothetical protein